MTVAEVLAEPPSVVAEPVGSTVARSVVPQRAEGMAASALPADYQRIMSVLESDAGREGMRCQLLAAALSLQAVPAKVEGLRSKAREPDRGPVAPATVRRTSPPPHPRRQPPAHHARHRAINPDTSPHDVAQALNPKLA